MKKIKDSFFVRGGVKFLFAGFLAVLLFAGCNNIVKNITDKITPVAIIPCKADSGIAPAEVNIVIKTYNTATYEGSYELKGPAVSTFPNTVGTEGTFKITKNGSAWKMKVTPISAPVKNLDISSSRELVWNKGGSEYKYDIPASIVLP